MVYYTCVVYNIRRGEAVVSLGLQASAIAPAVITENNN